MNNTLTTSPLDLQDRPLKSLRSQMHDPRDRERRRASPPVPVRRIGNALASAGERDTIDKV